MTERLSGPQRVGYALGSFGTGGFNTVPGLLLLIYLTDNLGVAAGLAGLIVAGPKFWDVFIAPVLGALSDGTAHRRGTRRPWLLLGGLLLPPLFVLMFAVPAGLVGGAGAAVWVAVAFTVAITAFATFQVSYLTMPAEFTDSYRERTRVMAWRIVFLTLAILLFGAGAPALVDAGGGGLPGYRLMAVVLAVPLLLSMLAAWWFTRGTRMWTSQTSEPTLAERFRAIRENRDFGVLLAAFVLQALAIGMMLAAAPFVATYLLGNSALTTVLFVALVGPAVLVMPIWQRVAARYGKDRGFWFASLLFLGATVVLIALRALPAPAVYALVAVVGIGYAGMQMFPLAMLPDTLAADAARHGRQRAGVFTGIWTAGETGGLAVGPGLAGFALAIFGFVSSTADEVVAQPDSALTGIVVAFAVVPSLLMLASLPFVRRYSLTEESLAEVLDTAGPSAPPGRPSAPPGRNDP